MPAEEGNTTCNVISRPATRRATPQQSGPGALRARLLPDGRCAGSPAYGRLTSCRLRPPDALPHLPAARAAHKEVIEECEGGVNVFVDPSKRIKGISTGFAKLDEMSGGLHGGELIILAARPSMGKTALALNIAQHVATRLNQTVAIFSLEMSKESLLTRMLCASARVDSQRFRAGYLNQDERRKLQAAAAQLVEAPLFIDDTAGVNLMEMHAGLRRLQQQRKLGLVVVDYLQLMSGRGRFENRNQEISTISPRLKPLSKELHVPMFVLSQLSRAPETRHGDHRHHL